MTEATNPNQNPPPLRPKLRPQDVAPPQEKPPEAEQPPAQRNPPVEALPLEAEPKANDSVS